MQSIFERDVYSATDLTNHLLCSRKSANEVAKLRGELDPPRRKNPRGDMVIRAGIAHEADYLTGLVAQGLNVVTIERQEEQALTDQAAWDGLVNAAEATQRAMAGGADVIYQATFLDRGRGRGPIFIGHADFLRRVDRPSRLGDYSYEVYDTKLAREARASALLQTTFYSQQLRRLQGTMPQRMYIVTGDGIEVPFPLRRYASYYKAFLQDFQRDIKERRQPYPHPVDHCSHCRWIDTCKEKQWRKDDDLSQLGDITPQQRIKLIRADIRKIKDLAETKVTSVEGMGKATFEKLQRRAVLRLRERSTGRPQYELRPLVPGRGLGALPEPSPLDVYADFEGHPFYVEGGLDYMFGALWGPDGGLYAANSVLARKGPAEALENEKEVFEHYVDRLISRKRFVPTEDEPDVPPMHIYHYGNYETVRLRRLAARHGTRMEEVDELIGEGVFTDLYQVAKDTLLLSKDSMSIKALEVIYSFHREQDIEEAQESIDAFEEWLETGDERLFEKILRYNEEDCLSTLRLHEFLEKLRTALIEDGVVIDRPEPRLQPRPELVALRQEIAAVYGSLVADLPSDREEWTDQHEGKWLMAQMVEWHRREARTEFFDFFRRLEMTNEELVEDSAALSGLELIVEEPEPFKNSLIFRYRFDPKQQHSIKEGYAAVNPATKGSAGTVQEIDRLNGIISISRRADLVNEHPSALIPQAGFSTKAQQQALLEIAASVEKFGFEAGGGFEVAKSLLLRKAPMIAKREFGAPLVRPKASPGVAAVRAAMNLEDGSVFAIQGPPGTGKTQQGSAIALALANKGERVFLCVGQHAAITEAVDAVCVRADERGVTVPVVQRVPNKREGSAHASVTLAESPRAFHEALADPVNRIFAGTPAAASQHRDTFDTIIVDEAGLMSLANMLAVSAAGKKIIMLGDPQQLEQPTKGDHPKGAEVSALRHYMGDDATVPRDRGVFLGQTWRMGSALAAFSSQISYDGRLRSAPAARQQRIVGDDPVAQGGVSWVASDEPQSVAKLYNHLIGRTWIDSNGEEQILGHGDILLQGARNDDVHAMAELLPQARVTTVHKAQSQEAAVSIFFMRAGDTAEASRRYRQLFSINLLNVAMSRGRTKGFIVADPGIAFPRAYTAQQMEMSNALITAMSKGPILDENLRETSVEFVLPQVVPPAPELVDVRTALETMSVASRESAILSFS